MPDEAAQPDDELTQAIKRAILAGAAEGAEATATRIAAAANTGLDEVRAVLEALGTGVAPRAASKSRFASPSSMAAAGRIHVAAAAFSGEGTLSVSRSEVAAAALSGFGTLGVGVADVAAAVDELRVTRQPGAEGLVSRSAVMWTRQELVLNSLFLVVVVYWLLPTSVRPVLTDIASLMQGVDAVVSLLRS